MSVPLTLTLGSDIHLPTKDIPPSIISAIRRYLRNQGSGTLRLLRADADSYHLPIGLLPALMEILARHTREVSVIDRRTYQPQPPLPPTRALDERLHRMLPRILARDCGILAGGSSEERIAIVCAVIARRRQRTLIFVPRSQARILADRYRQALGLSEKTFLALDAIPETVMAILSQTVVMMIPYEILDETADFPADVGGMVVLEAIEATRESHLLSAQQRSAARYTLGVSTSAHLDNEAWPRIRLALGGVIHELAHSALPPISRIILRPQRTSFFFPYLGRAHYQSLLAALARDSARAQTIAADITQEAETNNTCLILSERREHLARIRNNLPQHVRARSEMISSATSHPERNSILAALGSQTITLLFATGQIATSGIDLRAVGCLFITFPLSYGKKMDTIVNALVGVSPDRHTLTIYDYDDAHVLPLHQAYEKRDKRLRQLRNRAANQIATWAQTTLKF